MIIGVGLDSRLALSMDELVEAGSHAQVVGFESIWTPSVGVPDAFHVCGRWADQSRRDTGVSVPTGIGVVPAPRAWKPVSLAAQAATVSLISAGHFVLGIGSGGAGPGHWAAAGLPNRPLGVMRDYLAILRALLAGEAVDYDGAALSLHQGPLGGSFPRVPVYLAALGPQMLRLAGEAADGVSLNWATPTQIAWSRTVVAEGAANAGRRAEDVPLSMYIRVCVDEDVEAARVALATQVLNYGLVRPGVDPTLAYRGHFARMGFDEALTALEARREAGERVADLTRDVPEELLAMVGYYGPAKGAAARYRELSEGLDETIVRITTARPGLEPVFEAMDALTPAKIRES